MTGIQETNSPIAPLPARKMHGIVLGMVGLCLLVAATYPLGMYRVASKSDGWGERIKVKGIYVKSLDAAKKQPQMGERSPARRSDAISPLSK